MYVRATPAVVLWQNIILNQKIFQAGQNVYEPKNEDLDFILKSIKKTPNLFTSASDKLLEFISKNAPKSILHEFPSFLFQKICFLVDFKDDVEKVKEESLVDF